MNLNRRNREHLFAVLAVLSFLFAAFCFFMAGRANAATSVPDHAKDTATPGCVSWPEWHDASRGTMSATEREWQVVGAGHVVQTQQHGQFVLKQYPYCGYNQSDAFVQVFYAMNVNGQYMAQYVSLWMVGQ